MINWPATVIPSCSYSHREVYANSSTASCAVPKGNSPAVYAHCTFGIVEEKGHFPLHHAEKTVQITSFHRVCLVCVQFRAKNVLCAHKKPNLFRLSKCLEKYSYTLNCISSSYVLNTKLFICVCVGPFKPAQCSGEFGIKKRKSIKFCFSFLFIKPDMWCAFSFKLLLCNVERKPIKSPV